MAFDRCCRTGWSRSNWRLGLPVIMILADPLDGWALAVEQELLRRQQVVRCIEPGAILDCLLLNWSLEELQPSVVSWLDHGADGSEVHAALQSVFLRTNVADVHLPAGHFEPRDQPYVEKELSAALYGWVHSLVCPVINLPVLGRDGTLSTSGVEYHRALMRVDMVSVPTTVVARVESGLWWFDHWNRDARVQPIGHNCEALHLRGAEGLERLQAALESGPVALQPMPEGKHLHVFVVGETVIGSVRRTAVQNGCLREQVWDQAALPPNLAQRWKRLAQERNLLFAEIEVVVGHDGAIYCLGLSGSPVYARCSDLLRRHLVEQLATLLERTKESYTRDLAVRTDGRSHRGEPVHASSCSIC